MHFGLATDVGFPVLPSSISLPGNSATLRNSSRLLVSPTMLPNSSYWKNWVVRPDAADPGAKTSRAFVTRRTKSNSLDSGVISQACGARSAIALRDRRSYLSDVKDQILELLLDSGRKVSTEIQFDWLTNRVPTEPDPALFLHTKNRLLELHDQLGGDSGQLMTVPKRMLNLAIQVDDNVLVEIDGLNHFSSVRLDALKVYQGINHNLNIDLYERLCNLYKDRADGGKPTKEAPGFPFIGGQTAQRAYFDAVKDLVTAAHGFR